MARTYRHVSDKDLVMAADGELGIWRSAQVRGHVAACWTCRARQAELGAAITDFVHHHLQTLDSTFPPPAGPRALLKARIAASVEQASNFWRFPFHRLRWLIPLVLVSVLLPLALTRIWESGSHSTSQRMSYFVPDPDLTPGATVLVGAEKVCYGGGTDNRDVAPAMQKRVLEEYGIADGDPHAYEIDYLITPRLGGADDIRNLWPEPYRGTIWNAEVKDALESRLHELVCQGTIDLATAQREMSSDWISAYKKYFHSDRPL